MIKYFDSAYTGKKVLLFGHTGFKGTWLTLWLNQLGARIVGASIGMPSEPCHFESAGIENEIDSRVLDIRDAEAVRDLIEEVKPDFVFHLAAQALVRQAYIDPLETFTTNTIGTANILNGLRDVEHPCAAVFVTSDKCYENVETYYGYRETDRLGGKDPYSASKGAAELVIHSFHHSFFSGSESPVRFASTRAGNVVGGGDWAVDRLVPDMVSSWARKSTVTIRQPGATRPWQHVLEPLSGYLLLGASLSQDAKFHGESYNFGPNAQDIYPVREVVQHMSSYLPGLVIETAGADEEGFLEAGLLKLCCDKALHQLEWQPVLDFGETMEMTAEWYRQYYQKGGVTVRDVSDAQITDYVGRATERGLVWVG